MPNTVAETYIIIFNVFEYALLTLSKKIMRTQTQKFESKMKPNPARILSPIEICLTSLQRINVKAGLL